MKKINKTLIKGLALTLGVCSLIPLTACGNNNDGGKSQIWNAEKAYVEAQEQGFTGTYQEFLQSMANIRNIEINANGDLVFTLGDGTVFNAGGVKGPAGNGIKSVTTEHDDENKKTIITITFNDDTYTTVDVPDGQQGEQGEKGDKGGDGEKGEKGDTGVGIANIATTEKDRWGIVHKITYTMTNGVTYTFDIGGGVAYGRTYDAKDFDEFSYLIQHNVTNIVLTGDISCPRGGYNFYPINQQDTYYSLDLNGHTFYGVMQLDATANDDSDLPYGIYMDISNGKIDSVNGITPLEMETLSILGSNINLNLNNLEIVGHSSAISTNGDYNGVEIVAESCKFTAVDTGNDFGIAAYFPAGGHYDFTSCWFAGSLGINIKSGLLELEYCHVEGTGEYEAPAYVTGASTGNGSALVVSSTKGYHNSLSVQIRGSELISTNGYGLEEVSLAPEGQQAGYIATISVDNQTRFEGGLGEYISQNDVITIQDDGENPTDPTEDTSVLLQSTPSDAELIAYAAQGKNLITVQSEGKEYKIALLDAADASNLNIEESMSNVNRVVLYRVDEGETNLIQSIEVAHSADEIQTLVEAEIQSFVSVGVQLNQIPTSIFDNNNYYIEKQMDSIIEKSFFKFVKTDIVTVLMNSASVTYQGQTLYVSLTNTTEGIANIQIDTELEGLNISKLVLSEQDGYINSITEEDFSTGATMSSGETVVLRISLTGEYLTEKTISFIFSNGLVM